MKVCLSYAVLVTLAGAGTAVTAGGQDTGKGSTEERTDLDVANAISNVKKEAEQRAPHRLTVKHSEAKWRFLRVPDNSRYSDPAEQRYWVMTFFETKDTDVTSSQHLFIAVVDTRGSVKEYIPICLHISAPEIFSAFQENQIAANASFKGKVIWIDGTIDRILADKKDNPYIVLFSRHREGEASVICRFGPSEKMTVASLSRARN